MILERAVKPSLTPLNLGHGDGLRLELADGSAPWEMVLLETRAEVRQRGPQGGVAQDPKHTWGDVASYGFSALVRVNGREHLLERVVGEQASFYEPWEIDGVLVWLDAVACAFTLAGGFMAEKDWRHGQICQPDAAARFAVQEAGRSVCPEPLHLWYPNPHGHLNIADCYNGEDCWMGPYAGGSAHCGLDVNMPPGTVLTAPITFDTHYHFNSVAAGYGNNRWRGLRIWEDGAEWQLQCHHQGGMRVPERGPLPAGTVYATGAETAVGRHPHSHFMFKVIEQGGQYWLDPWILFWQAFRDQGGVIFSTTAGLSSLDRQED